MIPSCDYCRGPIARSRYLGRPWPGRPAASYCCYGCLSLGESDRQESTHSPRRFRFDGMAIRIGVGLLVAGQSMIFGLAINLEEQTPAAVRFGVQGVILAGTLLVLALLGTPLLRSAVSEIRRGRLTIEALFLLTMAGAMAASLQSYLTGRGPIYFEVVSVLLVVYSLGKAIGARSRAAALASARIWSTELSRCRLVAAGGRLQDIDAAAIVPGDLVEVRPGEIIAVDGVIREGTGFISEASVSGEPFAVVRRPGDRVLSGMISADAAFRIEATAPGTARQIDRLLLAVEEARSRPISLQGQADRLGRILFPLVAGTALLTFLFWTQRSGWETGLFNAMSVLLVACPCALGLATPIVLWSALNRLAERGIVAHAGDVIERLAQVDRVVFDKTGTLTEERFAIVDLVTLAEGDERARVLGYLSLVEERSRHPIARPFAELPRAFVRDCMPRVVSLRVIAGAGVEAELVEPDREGECRRIRVGRPGWIGAGGSTEETTLLARLLAGEGHRIDVSIDGRLAVIALVAERLRDSASEALAALKKLNLPVEVLTGDLPERAAALSLPEVRGRLLPEEKRQRIEELKGAGGKPLMIGDGVNDASALAAAHAGIAISSGADLANSAASATLYHGDLRIIPWAIAYSRLAIATVRRNLLRAAAYNLIGIALAACGVLHPVVAALLMVASSLLTAFSSVRIGAAADWCGCDPPGLDLSETRNPSRVLPYLAAGHALAIVLQALAVLLLLKLSAAAAFSLAVAVIVIGMTSAKIWQRWAGLPHGLDMAYGMLSFGNLGMLIGWWADNGFSRLHDGGCCACVEAMREGIMQPWMWLGMLAGANLAMAFFGRRPHSKRPFCRTAMLTGGNLGMVAGMILGGWLASQIKTDSVPLGFLLSFLGMTVGMIGGMLAGGEITRWLIDNCLRWRHGRRHFASEDTTDAAWKSETVKT